MARAFVFNYDTLALTVCVCEWVCMGMWANLRNET